MLPPLRPRYYSISSSPLVVGGHLQHHRRAWWRARRAAATGVFRGVCSNYLAAQPVDATVYGFVRKPTLPFHPPENPHLPMIMVGPGTGVAPFRGFLQERAALKQQGVPVGESLLFFGCRDPLQDFLYEDELRAFEAAGVTRLYAAFSREPGKPKTYVQQAIEAHGDGGVAAAPAGGGGLRLRRRLAHGAGRPAGVRRPVPGAHRRLGRRRPGLAHRPGGEPPLPRGHLGVRRVTPRPSDRGLRAGRTRAGGRTAGCPASRPDPSLASVQPASRRVTRIPRRWWILAAMALPMFLLAIDFYGVAVALPSIGAAFGAGTTALQWTINAFNLALAAPLLAFGRLGDVVGRRRTMLAGILLFAAGSALCGGAPGMATLILGRCVQGLAVALFSASPLSIVSNAFPPGSAASPSASGPRSAPAARPSGPWSAAS